MKTGLLRYFYRVRFFLESFPRGQRIYFYGAVFFLA